MPVISNEICKSNRNIFRKLIVSKSKSFSDFQPCLPLKVLVSDGGPSPRQTTVWVMVQVLDENDNKPTFPEKVYQVKLAERERRKKGEPIYRVFAYDRDEGPNGDLSYSIVDGNEEGKFFIDPKTAVVSSRKAFSAGSYDILTVRKLNQRVGIFEAVFPCRE